MTDGLSWAAVVLFAIIFFWTPPHYWPLSLRFRDDYEAAGVPMLPVVASRTRVGREIIVWLGARRGVAAVDPPAPMGWLYHDRRGDVGCPLPLRSPRAGNPDPSG